jgi:Cu(I)/Ag(I) efflux system membrane fusion protein
MLPQDSPNIIGVTTSAVKRQPLVRTLRLSGMIGEDMSRHGVISAPVEGRIDGLSMNHAGQQVTLRQPLATIFSRTLLAAANDYKLALTQGGAAVDDARRRLEQYGLVWEQIKTIPQRQPDDFYFGVLSPRTGVIVQSYVSEGQQVKAGERMFEVADFTTMWLMLTVYEQDLAFLQPRQIVHVTLPSLPGQSLHARIGAINPNLDEGTRSAMVRVVIENPDRKIMNHTFAEATVDIETPEVLAVPRTAVLWSSNTPRVYVEKAIGSYQLRQVKLGRIGDALWEVIDGVQEGEHVVTKGNMLIDSQAQLDALAMPVESTPATPLVVGDPAAITSYFKAVAGLNLALANDDLVAANTALKQLPQAPANLIKTPAPTPSADIKSLRKAFLPWSQEIATAALKWKSQAPELHIFCCPMTNELWSGAPANAAWIQVTSELRNPYWGREMLECGMEVKP